MVIRHTRYSASLQTPTVNSQHQLSKQAVEGRIEVGGEAGMRTGGCEAGTADSRQPAETLMRVELTNRPLTSVGNPAERIQLTAQRINVGIGTECFQPRLVNADSGTDPTPALAHHHKPDIDKFLTLNTRKKTHDGIFKQVIFVF